MIYDPFPRAPSSVRVLRVREGRQFVVRSTTTIHVAKQRPNVRVLKSGRKRITVK